MSKTAARLTRAEQETHRRVLAELANRRGVLRWVCFAGDAEPDPAWPGYWRSETFDMLVSLPPSLSKQGMDAIGYEWEIEPETGSESDEA